MTQLPKDGFLILDKPTGITSAKAVAQVKKLLKCEKIGHGGTLDPLASGVLPLAIGEATKAFAYVADAKKEYRFTVTFGQERTTADAEGEVSATTDRIPTREEILKVLPEFIGKIMQTPPAYSAISIDGKRAYERARAGEEVEMTPRQIEVYDLKLISFEGGEHSSPPLRSPSKGVVASAPPRVHATFVVTCGKGTYVRSLGVDIARKVNSLGYISMLRRVSVGKFHEKKAISLANLAELVYKPALFEAWVPIELALDDIPAINMEPDEATRLSHGQALKVNKPDGNYMALSEGHILALVEIKDGVLRSQRVFNI